MGQLTGTNSEGTVGPARGTKTMMDVTRGARGEVVIHVDGTFDRQAASRLSSWLGELSPATPVLLDFSRVREFQDLGLAAMAARLTGRGDVHVVGLGRHQERLLRYFGVDATAIGLRRGDEEKARG
jgi:hypothetical protein